MSTDTTHRSDPNELLQDALRLQRSGELDAAAGLCEQLLEAHPGAPEVLQRLGLIRKQQGRYPESELLLRACVDHQHRRPDFQTNLGNLLMLMGKVPEAEFVFRAALEIDPEFRLARLSLARLFNRHEFYVEAQREAAELLARNREDAQACVALGRSFRGQQRLADAELAYRHAVAIKPDYGIAHHNLAAVLAELSRPAEALPHFQSAYDLGVRGPAIDANYARALIALDRRDEAFERLQNTVQKFPDASDPRRLLETLRRPPH